MINLEPRKSLPERKFEEEGYLLLKLEQDDDVNIEAMMYEWVTFNLPGEKDMFC
jgi:hypothetical protein